MTSLLDLIMFLILMALLAAATAGSVLFILYLVYLDEVKHKRTKATSFNQWLRLWYYQTKESLRMDPKKVKFQKYLAKLNATANGAYSYKKPEHGAPQVRALKAGEDVTLSTYTKDWFQIGPDEWIWRGHADPYPIAPLNETANGAFSYKEPKSGAPQVRALKAGESVTILSVNPEWYRIGPDEWIWQGHADKPPRIPLLVT